MFDPDVDVTPADQDRLVALAQDLVDLPRSVFLASMRAIRRYTLGLERLGDEPDLAYSLLVASIESLAQEFDAFIPTWGDIAQQRREPVDAALRDAPEDVVARVRGAILTTEHAALARRFRDFAIANVAPSYFREEALGSPKPTQRDELAPALNQAYKLRSKYIHTLRELPREMQVAVPMWDVTTINGPVLTFRGLARLARHVIFQFISRHPKVAREPLNYWQELPNLIRLQPANRYWIWNAENYSVRTAHRYLSGFLEDLAAVLQRVPDGAVTDMREVLAKIERIVPGLARPAQRLPMVTLHFLFHQMYGVAPEHHERSVHFLERYLTLFDAPSPESMIAHIALNQETGWTAAQFQDAWTAYQAQRFRRDALVLPRLFEAASLLTLAELHRRAADAEGTRTAIAAAVEAMPGVEQMLELERDRAEGGTEEVIEWRAVLLPPTTAPAEPQTDDLPLSQADQQGSLGSGTP